MDYQYDSSSSALKPVELSNDSANLAYDPVPRNAADAPLILEAPPAGRDGGPPRRGGRAMIDGAFAAKLAAAVPDPVVLIYRDLEALEAAALLAVCEGLMVPTDADADPWEQEQDAEAALLIAVVWRKLHHARRDGRPVAVERTLPPDSSGPGRI